MFAFKVATIAFLLMSFSCKVPSDAETAGSGLASVAIKLPDQVKGVSTAVLSVRRGAFGSRTFTSQVESSSSGGSSIVFAKDDQNEALKSGESLSSIFLELKTGRTAVYSGSGNPSSITVTNGQNQISFSLECKDPQLCPTGSDLQVIEVKSTTTDPANAPSILAEVNVQESGMTEQQKRSLLSQCKAQVQKKTCSQWDTEVSGGKSLCDDLIAVEPGSVCAGQGTFSACLDDYLDRCKKLGIVR